MAAVRKINETGKESKRHVEFPAAFRVVNSRKAAGIGRGRDKWGESLFFAGLFQNQLIATDPITGTACVFSRYGHSEHFVPGRRNGHGAEVDYLLI
jgi:hypothetical protein